MEPSNDVGSIYQHMELIKELFEKAITMVQVLDSTKPINVRPGIRQGDKILLKFFTNLLEGSKMRLAKPSIFLWFHFRINFNKWIKGLKCVKSLCLVNGSKKAFEYSRDSRLLKEDFHGSFLGDLIDFRTGSSFGGLVSIGGIKPVSEIF